MADATRSMRVMVVDDSADTVTATAMLFRLDGHEVMTAESGMAALALAPLFRPELILLDIGMPEQDGYATAQRIQRLPLRHRPYIVAVTGYGTKADKRHAAQAGFDLHLTKPVSLETYQGLVALLQTSRSVVERSRLLTARQRAAAAELMGAQLEMAHVYLDTAAISSIPDAMRIGYLAHASRAHERISTWLLGGACSDEQAGVVLQALRRLKDRMSGKNKPAS